MAWYVVNQGFHLGEIHKDIPKGIELEFDEILGHLSFGEFKSTVRISPIVGAIKKGWMRLKEEPILTEEAPVKFEGVEESRPIVPEKLPNEKKEIGRIEYEESSKPLKESPHQEEEKPKIKIGQEDREDEKVAISLDSLKNLSNSKDADSIVKNWDLHKHWATRKKEMFQINNINILMKIASIDPTLKKYIDEHIKELSPLGHEVNQSLEVVVSEEPKEKPQKGDLAPLGKDFDVYMKEKFQDGEIQVQKPPK